MRIGLMMRSWAFLVVFFALSLTAYSGGIVEGVVKDGTTGETLIGVNIVYGAGMGTVTDIDGYYSINLENGTYTLRFSYVGYNTEERKITLQDNNIRLDVEMSTVMLNEVEVVGDLARSRETPVAFSTVEPKKMEEELASQDIPMILNSTPGVYATQQGGGDGDARINIRGFSQRNVAVMIDGIPMNDMENGWVYWSNWFGLEIVTQRIQVQRGLGASKLALPSIGGTMNIITSGIQNKRKLRVKQEVGNDGYLRTSLGFTSGPLKNGWGFTVAGSYKRGDGWVDRAFTEGWFYYAKVDKKFGNHILSVTAMGAPQEHGQRRFQKPIAVYSEKFAREQGITESPGAYFYGLYIDTNYMVDKGLRYNSDWGKYVDKDGNTVVLNDKKNYYHKPQFTLRHFWNINEKLYWSNIVYLSLGNGGGTSTKRSVRAGQGLGGYTTTEGQINFQKYYDDNLSNTDSSGQARSYQFIRSQVNNHRWYGLLSTFNYNISNDLTLSGGLDLRRYTGEHYEQVYNLLGGDYTEDTENSNRNPDKKLYEGDKINYHNDGIVQWSGLFAQLEYKAGSWSAFVNLTGAFSGYKKIDYFAPRVLEVGDTSFTVAYSQQVEYNGEVYDHTSPGLKWQESDTKWIPGGTIKAGVNYNISERSNIFANVGYLNKAPQFNNVFDRYSIDLLTNIENEYITAFELGYAFGSPKFAINANGYYTIWKNKPGFPVSYPLNDDEFGYGNIQGMDALHMGIEFDFAWKILHNLDLQGLLSLGDWRYTSADSVRLYNDNNQIVRTEYFNAEGVHVGDAAQTQIGGSIRYEPIRYLYFNGRVTYFARHFADFNPFDLNPEKNPGSFDENGNPIDSWKAPSYFLVDFHAGYSFFIKKVKLDVRGSILNLLDEIYISDARDNDSYSTITKDHDAKSAGVFMGMGRRFNISLAITL